MKKKNIIFGYWPRSSYKSSKGGRLLSALILVVIAATGVFFVKSIPAGWASVSSTEIQSLIRGGLSGSFLKAVLRTGLPLMEVKETNGALSPEKVLTAAVSGLTSVNIHDPRTFINYQFGYLRSTEPASTMGNDSSLAIPEEQSQEKFEEETQKGDEDEKTDELMPGEAASPQNDPVVPENMPPGDNPLVGIYTTHNAESYLPSKGVQKVDGENGDVARVAEVLESTLEQEYGVAVVRSREIHDFPDWNLSYSNSKETAKKMLAEHPSIQILVDIHRDAGLKEKEIQEIDGQTAAKILFIVGSDQRLGHPQWKKNKEFAERVHAKMQEIYPGLSRGVRVQSGRYNQHLHPHAVLVEIGNVKNTLREAEWSAALLAHVFSEVLKDIRSETL